MIFLTPDNETVYEEVLDHMIITDVEGTSYKNPIRQFLAYCELVGANYSDNLDVVFFDKYILYLKQVKQIKSNSVYIHLASLKFFYRFLISRGKASHFVLEELCKLKVKKDKRTIKEHITKEELDEIIEMTQAFYTTMPMQKVKTIMYFMFFTGVRRDEIINLKRDDIDLDSGEALIKLPTKNREERYIFFTKEIVRLLRAYFISEPEITNAFNITKSKLRSLVEYAGQFTKKPLSPHTFRHSFAHYLARNGVDIKVAQKLLGHKSLATTEIYFDPDKEDVKNVYKNKIDK